MVHYRKKDNEIISGGCKCGCCFNTFGLEHNDAIRMEKEFYKLHYGSGHGACSWVEAMNIREEMND